MCMCAAQTGLELLITTLTNEEDVKSGRRLNQGYHEDSGEGMGDRNDQYTLYKCLQLSKHLKIG